MKAWGGRFTGTTDPLMERFSASIDFDWLLYPYDIRGSIAHAEMLARIGIISDTECARILDALTEINQEIADGSFLFSIEKEDIHMHIESRLIEKIGDTGKKLHTARSRNDQVSLDVRMYVKEELARIDSVLVEVLSALLNKAQTEADTVMPGYTHLQRAQIITFGHYLLAYYFMLKRDRVRLKAALDGADAMPLGSGALAGSTIPLDREFVRERLGFSRLTENSIDSVSDRDFMIDAIYAATMVMLHLSRFAEDMILFSTEEFGYISLPDALCTGSSLMPQKKNPDALELTRGKAARVLGDLMSLMTLMKGLPLAYNRDLQEDKEALFHSLQTVKDSLEIMKLTIKGLETQRERLETTVARSFMAATEIAEYLVSKGVPFREAHGIVGSIVRDCEMTGKYFSDLTSEELKGYSDKFEGDIFALIVPRRILENRKTAGGASFEEVRKTIEKEKHTLCS